MHRYSALTLGLLTILGAAGSASADPVQWDLSTLTFQATSFPSGVVSTGTVTGSFTYNADTNTYTTWSLDLSGFPGTGVPASGLLVTPANTSLFCSPCAPNFLLIDSTLSSALSSFELFFTQPLTDAGGTVSIGPDGGFLIFDTLDFGTFHTPGGSLTATPEPSASALVVLVAFGLCLTYQRRRITKQAHSAQVVEKEV